jgi:hypothetical protein
VNAVAVARQRERIASFILEFLWWYEWGLCSEECSKVRCVTTCIFGRFGL